MTVLTTYGMTDMLLQATNNVNMKHIVSLICESILTEKYIKKNIRKPYFM